ncbi:phasin family protein [Vacuolonema iberomarrocanum]|uniref:phasin family protein n=1 Tax=Vacuolonema iberomarrocanum TaxID=3454632 RepID=UPI0019F20A9A|nr:hypothetical protein [filamentous cyanobacterium LEGE 07170]
MAKFGDLVQKAFYLGVGLASYAGEKAGETLVELRAQAQKLADELVAKGEITAEEAKRMVDDMVIQAQQTQAAASAGDRPAEPRRIEILDDDDDTSVAATPETPPSQADALRGQVEQLQEELRRLRNQS